MRDVHEASSSKATGLRPGARVGPYELIRLLGTGGMAEVWLAQRADGAFKREVALKLPLVTRLRNDLESRFLRERDILAGLEHPNIARLYDGGIDSNGLPYLAMEFVHGRQLTLWCDDKLLGIRERLTLFLQVLAAVQCAHERHVIHRDIKPSNILVTETGEVRLLDFGVAKLLEEDSRHSELTRIYGQAMTPEYASPEYLRGRPVDAASDVYSLGVIGYELLCGSRPYRIKQRTSPEALAHAIEIRGIKPPSRHIKPEAGAARATTGEKLARDLRGDLDAIVLKALALDRVERYSSAKEFRADLQRYLDGQPVAAQPPRLSYRMRKFVLRNRVGVAVGAALLAFVAAGYEVVARQFDRVKAEATAAAALTISEKSVAVLPFRDISERHDQEYLSDGLSEEVIGRLSKSPELKVIARKSSFSFKGKKDDVRAIAARLGVANVLEGSVRKSGNSLRVTVELIKAKDGALLWSQTYDRSLDDVFRVQDDIAENVTSELKAALNVGGAASDGRPSTEAYHLFLKGNFYLDRNTREDVAKAIALYRESIKLDSRYAPAWARLALASYRQVELGWGPPREALSQTRDALKKALEIDPSLLLAHYLQGEIDLKTDWDWAAAAAEVDRMHALGGTDDLYETKLRADIALLFGNFDDAIRNYRHVLDHDPLNLGVRNSLAVALVDAGDLQGAISTWHEVVELSPTDAYSYSNLSGALLLSGRIPEALEAADKEADVDARRGALAQVYWALGRRAEAEEEVKQLEAAPDPSSFGIAQIYALRSDKETATRWLNRAYQQHDPDLAMIKVDAFLTNLHGDPRYQTLLARMKLDAGLPGAPN